MSDLEVWESPGPPALRGIHYLLRRTHAVIVMLRAGGRGLVLAIEAHPRILRYLKRNIALNRRRNVEAVNIAVGDRHASMGFTGSISDDQNAVQDKGDNEIRLGRLDTIAPVSRDIALLKIDVEGYERHALRGAPDTLARTACVIFEAMSKHYARYMEEGTVRRTRSPYAVVRSTVVRAALLLTVVGTSVMGPWQVPTVHGAVAPLPDTTNNIHLGLPFNYKVSNPQDEAGLVDFVWGSNYPTKPSGVYNTKYEPFDREPDYTGHDLTWFRDNHPDWIEYKCDKTTIAYEFGEPRVPLDITNPAVRSYFFQIYYEPAIQQQSYRGIGLDNVNLGNAFGRCGHYNSSGQWVQQFTGSPGDAAYHTAVLNWAQWMYTQLHGIGASVSMNFSYDFNDPADSKSLYNYIDIVMDERGFTNWGISGSNYLAGDNWLPNMQALQALDSQGKGLLSVNQEPETFSNISQAEKQWILANYLLVKGSHSWVYICGQQQYGSILTMPEYSAQIGAATNAMYQSQNVYMRDFANGKAIVNPSTSQSHAITLPQNTYKDLYGTAIDSVTLGPETGIVLLGSNHTTAPTASTTATVARWPVFLMVAGFVLVLLAVCTKRAGRNPCTIGSATWREGLGDS